MPNPERVSVYIDGFNLYFGLKSKYPYLKWLNVEALSANLLKENQILEDCNYFTARVRNNPNKERRQTIYLDALNSTNTNIVYGKYFSKPVTCKRCRNSWPGNEEKMTDVNIAVTILTDALQNKYDTVILISGDSDLTPPLRALKQFYPDKKTIVAFPPNRTSFELKNIADASFTIGRKKLAMSQLDEEIPTSGEHIITKPSEW